MLKFPARAAATALTAAVALAVLPSVALGQATRTWVSGVGDDANPCSRTAPCKTFAGAISKTAAKGEINVIDPGGFGAVTITKSIHIRAVGNTAGVLTNAANAINVSAGANDRVTLSGLDINGLDTAASGVKINSGRVVRIENCQIYGFATAGISFTPSTLNSRLVVQDTIIHDNTAGVGLLSQATVGGTGVTIRRTEFDDNLTGVSAVGTSQTQTVNLFRSALTDNTTGVLSNGAGASVRIGGDEITNNGTGLSSVSGGAIVSYGTNQVVGNGTDGAPTASVLPK
jgi:hypothetical protein